MKKTLQKDDPTEKGRTKKLKVGANQDATQAEALLRAAEEKYRGIFENALEGIFQTTPEGRFVSVNPALARTMGYGSPEELLAANINFAKDLYVDPSRRRDFVETLAAKGEVIGFECEYYKKDGSKFLGSVNARTIRDERGETVLYQGMTEDITERRKVEQELQRLTELNEKIVNNAPVAICTLDLSGKITSVNAGLASLCDLRSRAAEKLIGFDWLHDPFTVSCGLAAYLEKGLRGESFQLWDFPFVNFKGDRDFYIDTKGVPLKDKDGNIEGLLCFAEETTERVKTRAKLMQDAKRSFIWKLGTGIAHQLNNPLAMVVAYSEAAARNIREFQKKSGYHEELKDIADYLQIVEEEAFKCKIVVDDILNLPKKEGFEVTEVDVNDLIENLYVTMSPAMTRIRLAKEFQPSLPCAKGDVRALRQVFMNLITNAIDAVQRKTDGFITVRTSCDAGFVHVEVTDNGAGIPGSILDKIFEPFFTTKESGKGVGLGLSLCRELLNDMAGAIRVESKPGIATTFTVALPVAGSSGGGRQEK